MENEVLKVFDEERNEIGVASREEIHNLGLWHETFHCWFVGQEEEQVYIYLQVRSNSKKDYPGLLDITAAGHLLSTESVQDGVREVKEELGIDISMDDLISLGVINYSVETKDLIDNEFAHVFLYNSPHSFDDFNLQKEEVSGIVRVEMEKFAELWIGKVNEIEIEGLIVNEEGKRIAIKKFVTKQNFVPHEKSYYEAVIHGVNSLYAMRNM